MNTCTCCGEAAGAPFYGVDSTPVNSCLLISSHDEAIAFPKGQLRLAFCPRCGFIWNSAFDPALTQYSDLYESTQGYSPTFNRFYQRLAQDLIERFRLRGKQIVEIGCGMGEFLALLCETGGNSGIGFDPVFREGRLPPAAMHRLTFIKDLYSERYADVRGDFVCCMMTLEHIHQPKHFIETLRRTLGENSSAVVFILVPAADRILREGAFEDFYYEHCSYFSKAALGRLFHQHGFSILSLESMYDGQYLGLSARPSGSPPTAAAEPFSEEFAQIEDAVEHFRERCRDNRARWQKQLTRWQTDGKRVVLWGSGSKAVGFLTAVDVPGAVDLIVDINPHKAGTYTAGTGQQIILPDALRDYGPDVVIVMNPIYRDEIAAQLESLGQRPLLLTMRDTAALPD